MPAQARTKEAVRKARNDAYRELILEAAERVFAANGYREARVQQIAQAAGVATGTVYAIFPGKQDVYRAVHRANLDQLTRLYEEIPTDRMRCGDVLLERTAISTRFLTQRPDYLRIYLREAASWGLDPKELPSAATAFMDLELYRSGIERGELVDEDPEILQSLSIAFSQIVLFHWLKTGCRESTESLTARIQAFCRRSFFADAATA
jgi:AcrR family transcriptional regulator